MLRAPYRRISLRSLDELTAVGRPLGGGDGAGAAAGGFSSSLGCCALRTEAALERFNWPCRPDLVVFFAAVPVWAEKLLLLPCTVPAVPDGASKSPSRRQQHRGLELIFSRPNNINDLYTGTKPENTKPPRRIINIIPFFEALPC